MTNKYPTNPTWNNSIKNFFRKEDIECMEMRGFYLNEYDSVKMDIDIIFEVISSGDMPPDEPWSEEKISIFELWKNNDCPLGKELKWRETNTPAASSRYDDIYFITPNIGWAVNSNGQILKTLDSGENWIIQFQTPSNGRSPIYLRCIAFANEQKGWVGTFEKSNLLYHTKNGGQTWSSITNIPDDAPKKICGIFAVSESIIYASGTNNPRDEAKILKTIDSGNSWEVIDMSSYADSLIDIYFKDENNGFVVGGKTLEPRASRRNVKPVVLETTDGGQTWVNRIENQSSAFPLGEWGWKIQFINNDIGFISLENFKDGAILKTTNGGTTWSRLSINDEQSNKNLEGIGFISDTEGWVGGWGDSQFKGGYSSYTKDGGKTWVDSNEIGLFINRFRFFGNPVYLGFSCGKKVNRYSDIEPLASSLIPESTEFKKSFESELVTAEFITVWDHFGNLLFTAPKNKMDKHTIETEEEFMKFLSQQKPESPLLIIRFNDTNGENTRSTTLKLPPTLYKGH